MKAGSKEEPKEDRRKFEAAWRTYVRGHVVSRHAKEMIVQFMAACCGKSKRTDDDAEDVARQTRICPPNDVQLERLHRIMDEIGEKATGQQALPKRRAKAGAKAAAGEDSDDEAIAKRSEQMQNALHTTDKLWRRDKSAWQIHDLARNNRGNTRLSSHQGKETKSKQAKRKNKRIQM